VKLALGCIVALLAGGVLACSGGDGEPRPTPTLLPPAATTYRRIAI